MTVNFSGKAGQFLTQSHTEKKILGKEVLDFFCHPEN